MTTTSTIYLAGPMTGVEDYNYPEFHRVAGILRKHYLVVNPAEAFGGDQGKPFATYMRHDIEKLLLADIIVFLPGWADAVGAVFEAAVGAALGLELLEYRDHPSGNGYALSPALPLFDTDRDRLGFVLGTPVEQPELARLPLAERVPVGPEPMSTWAEADDGLLKAADHIVNGDRQRTYGHPYGHHTATAKLWSAYLERNVGIADLLSADDVSMFFILDKVSRVAGGDKVDNVLDIAGYAQVHAKVRARQEAGV